MSRHLKGGVKYWSRSLPEENAGSDASPREAVARNGRSPRVDSVSRGERRR
jgi:hypothetical protein